MQFVKPALKEDVARADLYALLARLFYQAPDAALLGAIVNAQDVVDAPDTPLGQAWRALQTAAQVADVQAVADEFTTLFVGVGKAAVSVYASHYLSENYKELTLVHLREELGRLGLARKPEAVEPEDHVAGLLDVMRHLVQRGNADEDLTRQASFFRSYLQAWRDPLCSAIEKADGAQFYADVARLLKALFAIEVEVFDGAG
jgi:TorA maturation chaperone TorD